MEKKSDKKNKNSAPIVRNQKQPNKTIKLKKQQAAKITKVVKDGLVKTPAPKSPKIGESPKVAKKENKKQNKPAQKAQKDVNGSASSPDKKPNAAENGKVPSDISPSKKPKIKIEKSDVKTEGTNDSAKPTVAKSSKKPNKKKPKKTSVDINNFHGTPAQTVYVGNLPTNTKRVELSKLFAPYGKIQTIRFRTANGKVVLKHKARKEAGVLTAFIVLDTAEAAAKALELNGTIFKDNHLRVRKSDKLGEHYEPKCTVFIRNLNFSANDDKLRQIFSSCGEIDYVRSLQGDKGCTGLAYVCFKEPHSVGPALELDGTMLDERPIMVIRYSTKKLIGEKKKDDFKIKMQNIGKEVLDKDNHLRVRKSDKLDEHYEPKCTVFIRNLNFSANDDKLRQIFSSCGEIDYVRSLQGDKGCTGLAYVCFKEPHSVGPALELNGTMLDERPIMVIRYSTKKLIGEKKKDDFKIKMQNIGKEALRRGKKGPSSFKKKTPAIGAKKPFKKGSPKKNLAGDEKKKKSEFRGVKSNVVKKNPKKKLPTHLKKLTSKIAPKDD